MNFKKIVLFIAIILIAECESQNSIKYSFFVAGHSYGKPGKVQLGLYDQFKSKFNIINDDKNMKFGILTGDIVRQADKESWDAVDEDLKKIKVPVYFSRGNHDGNLNFFKKRYGNTYQSFKKGKDIHIILDSNISEWNITGNQLNFLKENLSNLTEVHNIFIYVHHIIWWNESEYYIPYINSRDRMSKNLTFWSVLAPILRATKRPVFLFAGDVGAFDNEKVHPKYQSYSYIKRDNLTLITSGMGGVGKKIISYQ